jgi:hypothetical protein
VVCGVSAIARGEDRVSASAAGEFPQPGIVTEMAAPPPPAKVLDDGPLLPRRRRVATQPDAARDHAEPAGVLSPGAMGEGPGQSEFMGRPPLDVLAQVLQGLRRMA